MTLTVLNILYALVALGMIGLILLQRGAGAQAGSGFGSGASATVFGARGASNFLTRTTAVLGTLFFLLSLGMGMYIARQTDVKSGEDLGVMAGGDAPTTIETTVPASGDVPAAPAPDTSVVPSAAPADAATAAPTDVPAATPAATAPAASDVPAAGATAPTQPKDATAPATEETGKR